MNYNINNNKISKSNVKNNNTSSSDISDNNNMNNNNINNNNISDNNTNINNKNNDNQKKIRLLEEISKNGGVNRIFIMGDSIVKHVRGYEPLRKVGNCKVYAKSFPSAKVMCMEDLVNPTLREMPTHIILHVGTNDVPTKKSS